MEAAYQAAILFLGLKTLRDAQGNPIELNEKGIVGVPAYAQLRDQVVKLTKEQSNPDTGCNLFFNDELVVLDMTQPGFPIGGFQADDPNFVDLIDAIITWFLSPDKAFQMYQALPTVNLSDIEEYSATDQNKLTVSEQLLGMHKVELPQISQPFFRGFNPEEE
jgi:hypothetical protein